MRNLGEYSDNCVSSSIVVQIGLCTFKLSIVDIDECADGKGGTDKCPDVNSKCVNLIYKDTSKTHECQCNDKLYEKLTVGGKCIGEYIIAKIILSKWNCLK